MNANGDPAAKRKVCNAKQSWRVEPRAMCPFAEKLSGNLGPKRLAQALCAFAMRKAVAVAAHEIAMP
eukprot:8156457-Alexandrium_andersonii.AAC.1